MKFDHLAISLLCLALFSVLLCGCAGNKHENTPKYVCWDNSTVSDYHNCPPESGPQQTYVCPDGSVVSAVRDCPVEDVDEPETPQEDEEEIHVTSSNKPASRISSVYAFEEGGVIESYIILADVDGRSTIENGILGINITSEETDREIYYGEITVKKGEFYLATLGLGAFAHQDTIYQIPDISSYDFEFMEDECRSYCYAKFSVIFNTEGGKHLKESEDISFDSDSVIVKEIVCEGGDGTCPSKCNALTDSDCPKYSLGEKVVLDTGIEITLSKSTKIRHCYSEYGTYYSEYGYLYEVPISVKNSGTGSEYVSRSDFILIDSKGKQYETGFAWGDTCEGISEFESSSIYPGSKESGSLLFDLDEKDDLPSGETRIIYDPDYGEGDEIIFVFNE